MGMACPRGPFNRCSTRPAARGWMLSGNNSAPPRDDRHAELVAQEAGMLGALKPWTLERAGHTGPHGASGWRSLVLSR
jgi:hypothetical protein